MDVVDFLQRYKYLAMFGVLFLCGVGLPVPEEITLLASGLFIGWGDALYFPSALACLLGILAGDSILFGLGRYYGRRFMNSNATRWIFTKKRQARVRKLFSQHHSKTVFVARYFTGLRMVVYAYAGQHGMSWSRFLLLNGLSGVVYISIFLGIGWYATTHADHEEARHFAEELFRTGKHWFLLAIVLLILLVVFRLWWHRRKEKDADDGRPTEDDVADQGSEAGAGAGEMPGRGGANARERRNEEARQNPLR